LRSRLRIWFEFDMKAKPNRKFRPDTMRLARPVYVSPVAETKYAGSCKSGLGRFTGLDRIITVPDPVLRFSWEL